ncbi:MAG TPA: DUF721 domain-containing protein [Gammaproteobacteria bacterium]
MKSLKQFVHQDSSLDRLRIGARQLAALARGIRAVLPADARDHVAGCAPRPGVVVVLVDSAAWATQLRYLQHDILGACRQELGERIQRVQFKVLPPELAAGNTGKPPAPGLSQNTRRLLQGAAGGVDDEALAAALRRLSGLPDSDDQDAD